MMYIRGQGREYDDWAKVTGYSNWGWKGLEPFFLKHEGFIEPPTPKDNLHDATLTSQVMPAFRKENHGTSGPVRTSFATWKMPAEELWHQANRNMGLEWSPPIDAWSGDHLGGFTNLDPIDRSNGISTRSYAVTGYLTPNRGRDNLVVLTNATAEKVLTRETSSGLVARSVISSKDGERKTVNARKEIILCAGTVQTPQTLEVSGIGRPEVLEAAGIECKVKSDAVGEHLEEHVMTGLSYDLVDGEFSLDHMANESVAKEAMDQYRRGDGGPLANSFYSTNFVSVPKAASNQENQQIPGVLKEVLHKETDEFLKVERKILSARLQSNDAASLQFFIMPASFDPSRLDGSRAPKTSGVTNSRISVLVCLTHPFSRGSIHIDPKDPLAQPLIDPQYLQNPVDVEILSAGIRIADEAYRTSPLAEKIKKRVFPPPEMDMSNAKAREDYVRGNTRTEYHPIGTARLGAVVDERLVVKGVKNLRIADASVFPLSLSGNIMAPVYAVWRRRRQR